MKVLIIGGGPESGASVVRAEQLGGAIGARVHQDPWRDPNHTELEWCHFVVIVKRLKKRWNRWLARIQHVRKPVAWDCVDFWQQPEENDICHNLAIKSFNKRKGELGARLVIVATEQMQKDVGGNCYYLPHHHRPTLMPTPIRDRVALVGYEGNEKYIEDLRPLIERECQARGWTFVVNPPSLAAMDIVLALRSGVWDGRVCRQWKSGVKYVNSIAAGRPVITQDCAAFREIDPPGSVIQVEADLVSAFDHWSSRTHRQQAFERASAMEPMYRLDVIADQYRSLLAQHMRY